MSLTGTLYRVYEKLYLKPRMRHILNIYHSKLEKDYAEELQFIKKRIDVIPYECDDVGKIEIYEDEGMFYGLLSDKKLFFPKSVSKKECADNMEGLLREQSIHSPHRYIDDDFNIQEDTLLIDCGSAEGNFTLSVIDKVSSAVLFEPEKKYNRCLEKTFAPWQSKITVVNKYIADTSSESSVSLDDYFGDTIDKNIFIKMDLERHGLEALRRRLSENPFSR